MRSTHRRCLVATAMAGLVLGITGPAALAKPGGGTWTSLAPVLAPTEGMSTASVGNLIIAAYGYSGGDTNLTRIYNIASNTWSLGSPAPGPVSSEGTAVTAIDPTTGHEVMHALGGRNGAGLDNNRYDPVTDTWTALAPIPTPRDGLAAAVVDGGIYVIGGRPQTAGPCTGPPIASVERYDIATNTWSSVASLPNARSDVAAIAKGGKIYVFDGCTFSTFSNEVDIYDPATNTWSLGTPAPTARAGMYGAGLKGDNIYVMGGENGAGPLSATEVYNVSSDSWSTATAMPNPRGEMGVASHGGLIYTVGGALPAFGISVNTNDVFKP